MDAGDDLRERWQRGDALAMLATQRIMTLRRTLADAGTSLERHAFVLRSLKTPGEVETLRQTYGSRFVLIGVYAPDDERRAFLHKNIASARRTTDERRWEHTIDELTRRDESEGGPYGQNVRDTFHRADLFVRAGGDDRLRDDLRRLFGVLFGEPFSTPTRDEFAQFEAAGAARLSSEPGRQVGAALVSPEGEVIALGTNEVPRPGGGLYPSGDGATIADKREFCFNVEPGKAKVDTSNLVQREIATEIADSLRDVIDDEVSADELMRRILGTRLGALTEFGRAVHAEMAAVPDAARNGHAVRGATLHVTTFPCHTCARHLLAAGVVRVVYVAPYAKSLAGELHAGDIAVAHGSAANGMVRFEPFVGVAPHRYMTMFSGIRRKDDDGTLVEWDPRTARPRFDDAVPPEFRQNQPAYRVREAMLSQLVEEVGARSGLRVDAADGGRIPATVGQQKEEHDGQAR